MRVLLVGGGKVGLYLASVLRDADHTVTVIERGEEQARALSDSTKALVLEGDGTDVDLLRAADVDRTDWVLAITGKDEDNLVACQLALTLGAQNVLARLNDPKNRPTFDALDIPVVAVTDLMVQVISREVELDVTDLMRLALLGRGKVSLVEIDIPADTPDQRVVDLELPPPSILVSVVRGDEVIVPQAGTVISAGDRVLAVTPVQNEAALRDTLCRMPGGASA